MNVRSRCVLRGLKCVFLMPKAPSTSIIPTLEPKVYIERGPTLDDLGPPDMHVPHGKVYSPRDAPTASASS